MNSILQAMGIQQWQLQRRTREVVAPNATLEPAPIEEVAPAVEAVDLATLQDQNTHCELCRNGGSLFGQGNPHADWMFVAYQPNQRELEAGQFFAGRAGQLYEAMLQALGLTRDDVYTSSIYKCAANTQARYQAQCHVLLPREVALVAPKVMVVLGETAAQSLIKSNESLSVLRGARQSCAHSRVPVIASYSPAQMLDDAQLKAKVWQDLKQARAIVT